MSFNWRKIGAMPLQAAGKRRGPVLTVRRAPGSSTRGLLQFGTLVFPCALGRAGIGAIKREGDGRTPRAEMRILSGFYRADRRPRPLSALGLDPIRPADGWCDAPDDRNYNRPVRLPYGASAERMWRDDGLYDLCIVLDWNLGERRRGLGSCIFFHLARPGYLPTEGCVALAPRHMERLLPHLRRGARMRVTG